MVAKYTIAGRQIGSHILAMATLGLTGAASYFYMSGGSKAAKLQGPPIKASSSDEENFIKEFLKNAEKDDKQSH